MENVKRMTGKKGVIDSAAGSKEIHPDETLEFTPEGVYVYGADLYETMTFYPIYTLREIRMHDAEKEKMGANARKSDRAGIAAIARQSELSP